MTQINWNLWAKLQSEFKLTSVDKAKVDWEIYQEMLKDDKSNRLNDKLNKRDKNANS